MEIPFEKILLKELEKMSEEEKRKYGIMSVDNRFISLEEIEKELKKGKTLKEITGG
ncbi:MAG: hypothetical protein QXJ25_02260 [Candidatus Aenigmatarchaeota archaeon]